MKDKAPKDKVKRDKKNTLILILFIFLLFFFSATLYLFVYTQKQTENLQNNTTLYTKESAVYESSRLGVKFIRFSDDYKVTEYDQTEFYENFKQIQTPTLFIESPRFTLRIVKYLEGSKFNDYFTHERVPNGGLYTYTESYLDNDSRVIRKALSYSREKEINPTKDVERSILPESLIYFTTEENIKYSFDYPDDTDTTSNLFFISKGFEYIVSIKLASMVNGEDTIDYTGKYDVSNETNMWNEYLNKKNLTEIDTLVKSIEAI